MYYCDLRENLEGYITEKGIIQGMMDVTAMLHCIIASVLAMSQKRAAQFSQEEDK